MATVEIDEHTNSKDGGNAVEEVSKQQVYLIKHHLHSAEHNDNGSGVRSSGRLLTESRIVTRFAGMGGG